jgi:hypothetical protein
VTALQLIFSAVVFLAQVGPAAQLRTGMVLVYESEGAEQPPWTVDSLRLDAPLLPGARCAVVHLRRRPDAPAAEELRLCVTRDTLYRWEDAGSRWAISRPVGPGMVWTSISANGDTVRFETGAPAQETVSGLPLQVVPTTVTTTDSLGRPKRRLRERYALTLATATGGVFETPDSTAPGAWVARQAFELRRIQVP